MFYIILRDSLIICYLSTTEIYLITNKNFIDEKKVIGKL